MLLRHATTSPLGLLFTAFEIASLLSSYIPLQVKWCSTHAEIKKGEGTGGQKEQRPRQGRRSLGEGEGQGPTQVSTLNTAYITGAGRITVTAFFASTV